MDSGFAEMRVRVAALVKREFMLHTYGNKGILIALQEAGYRTVYLQKEVYEVLILVVGVSGRTEHNAASSAHGRARRGAIVENMIWLPSLHEFVEIDHRPFEGHFFGRVFADKGTVIAVDRPRLLHFTHFAPLSGLADVPENYHEIRIELVADDGGTRVTVTQENIDTAQHATASAGHWKDALATLAHRDDGSGPTHW